MKAIVCTKYGPPDVLQLREIEKPSPKDDEVLIRVHATTVTAGDCGLRSLKFPLMSQPIVRLGFGFRGPRKKILGQELAGEIESVGNSVKLFGRGDEVCAWTGFHLGGYAEYTCLREGAVLAIKPANMSYDEAATLGVGGVEAWRLLRRGNVQSGEKVLINGAGGSIGTFAVQIAKYYGAEVTGVESIGKLDMLRSIGADQVIDRIQTDFTRNGETYDVIFDVVGKSPFSRSIRSLKRNGRYLLGNPRLSHMVRGAWVSRRTSKRVIFGGTGQAEDLAMLRELVEAGRIRSVIDRRYPLEQMAEGHRYVDTGQKKGNVVISVGT
ncbi:MAG: NAD(P)-dependent alcohol dehydrogenase [Crenarchaeota archaeon 13_1_40CM_3_52_10]|nr:MAG: NAD(P)-dependent alcohol dehydrogenase [Crenarchaeota archaeon 13_1_40CM_3_52_10]